MTFGILVDDKVRFLSKYRRVRREFGCLHPDAARVAFCIVGRALLTAPRLLLADTVVVSLPSLELYARTGRLTELVVARAPFTDFFPLPSLPMKIDTDSNSIAPFSGDVLGRATQRQCNLTAPSSPCATQVVRVPERPGPIRRRECSGFGIRRVHGSSGSGMRYPRPRSPMT